MAAPEPAAELPPAEDPEPQEAAESTRVSAEMLPMVRLTDMKVLKSMTARDPVVLHTRAKTPIRPEEFQLSLGSRRARSVRGLSFAEAIEKRHPKLSSGTQFWTEKFHAREVRRAARNDAE